MRQLYKFLTLKGYLIIAFMMTLGFTLRGIGKLPDSYFAFFYTGLGSALAQEQAILRQKWCVRQTALEEGMEKGRAEGAAEKAKAVNRRSATVPSN